MSKHVPVAELTDNPIENPRDMTTNVAPNDKTTPAGPESEGPQVLRSEGKMLEDIGDAFETLDEESNLKQRTSFDAVRFRRSSNGFDRKYTRLGRYAFDVDDLPMPSRPGERMVHSEDSFSHFMTARAKDLLGENDFNMGNIEAGHPVGNPPLII